MGVIRWEEDVDGKWEGHVGWSHIATAGCYTAPNGSEIFALRVLSGFPGFKESVSPHDSIADCKDAAEELLQEWLDDAGLAPKPSRPETPPLPLAWHKKQIGNRMVQAGYIGKTEVCHVFDPDYHNVICWIIRLLPSFPGEPTKVSTRDIYPTVEDAKEVAQQRYDRFLLECRLKAGAA